MSVVCSFVNVSARPNPQHNNSITGGFVNGPVITAPQPVTITAFQRLNDFSACVAIANLNQRLVHFPGMLTRHLCQTLKRPLGILCFFHDFNYSLTVYTKQLYADIINGTLSLCFMEAFCEN